MKFTSHSHPDHVGGLMNGEKMVFPNAVVRADQHDVDFWLSQAIWTKHRKKAKVSFKAQWHH
jgi:glyoxylase-like metal-dependent hydrolase (beta-lactamase superfamily II)